MPSRCTGVVAAACTQGKRTQHGKPQCVIRDDQPDAREGQAGRSGVAERPVVPLKPRRCAHFSSTAGRQKGRRVSSFMRGLPLLEAEEHRMDIAAWLQDLGLERYAPAFRDNEIDW